MLLCAANYAELLIGDCFERQLSMACKVESPRYLNKNAVLKARSSLTTAMCGQSIASCAGEHER